MFIGKMFPVSVAVLALALCICGFISEFLLIPGTPILQSLKDGNAITIDQQRVLVSSREKALMYCGNAAVDFELGNIFLQLALQTTDVNERSKYILKSIDSDASGLKKRPFNAYAWSRLATSHILLGEKEKDKAVFFWSQSITVARFDPFLQFARLHQGVLLYESMLPAEKDILVEQFELSYEWNHWQLRKYLRKNDLVQWGVYLLSSREAKNYLLEPVAIRK